MANLIKYESFPELSSLQRQFFGDDWLSPIRTLSVPTTDVYTDKDTLVVEAHLPHFDEKDIDITLEEGALIISARRHEKEEHKGRKYVIQESSTTFYRRIQLPQSANQENIEAHLKDGLLKITVPLTQLTKPKKISIKRR